MDKYPKKPAKNHPWRNFNFTGKPKDVVDFEHVLMGCVRDKIRTNYPKAKREER